MICSIYNLGHNISEFTVFQCRSYLPKVQRNLKFLENLQKTFLYKSSYKLPNDLRLKISGNYNMLGKSKNWVETEFSLYFTLRKFFFFFICANSRNLGKSRYQYHLFFSLQLSFFTLCQIFFSGIVCRNTFLLITCPCIVKT